MCFSSKFLDIFSGNVWGFYIFSFPPPLFFFF